MKDEDRDGPSYSNPLRSALVEEGGSSTEARSKNEGPFMATDTLFKQVLLKQKKEKPTSDVLPTGLHQAKTSKKTNRRRS